MSREEDLALIEAVRNWRPPKEVHPSAMVAAQLYEDAGKKVTPAVIDDLRQKLNAQREDLIELAAALEGLTRFVMFLQHLGDEDGAERMVELLREYTHLYEPFWERVGEALENVGEDARGLFYQFVAENRADAKAAPKYDAPPPEGTVPLKNLVQPARPPPWAKKKG